MTFVTYFPFFYKILEIDFQYIIILLEVEVCCEFIQIQLYPNLKFFISGSTSLFIKKKTQESLAGRIKSLFLNPLNFREFLIFKDHQDILDNPLLFQSEIEKNFEMFLNNQFIESIFIPDINSKRDYYIGIIKKIIFEDIPTLFSVNNPEILWQIVRMIAQKPGMFIDYQNLANDIGLSNKTISSYLYYLEEAFIVKKIYNFSRNLITSEKRLKRFYLTSPSFSWALSEFSDIGGLVENLVPSLKNYQFFWRDPYHHEIDFINTDNQGRIIPIEIKYKKNIQSKEFKNILLFAKKFGCKRAILFKKGIEEKKNNFDFPKIEVIEKPIYKL